MKIATTILVIFIAILQGNAQNSVFNYTQYSEIQNQGKTYYIEFYTQWCGFCKQMKSETFSDSQTAKLSLKYFNAIQIDAETKEGRELAAKYFVDSYPTIVFFAENGKLIGRNEGFADTLIFKRVLKDMFHEAVFYSSNFNKFMEEKSKAMATIEETYKKSSPSNYELYSTAFLYGTTKDEIAVNQLISKSDFKLKNSIQLWYYMGEKNREKLYAKINNSFKEKDLNPIQMHLIAWYLIKNNMIGAETIKLIEDAEKLGGGLEIINTKTAFYLLNGNMVEATNLNKKAIELMIRTKQNLVYFNTLKSIIDQIGI